MAQLRKPHLFGLRPFTPRDEFRNVREFAKLYSYNTGNLAFSYAIWKLFGCEADTYTWTEPLTGMDPQEDVMVFAAANQIGAHVDMGPVLKGMARSDIPIVVIGLGAQFDLADIDMQAIPEGTTEWIRHLIARAPVPGRPSLTLRGETTLEVFRRLGLADHAIVTGCPSNFISARRNLGVRIKRKIDIYKRRTRPRVAVAAGSPNRGDLLKLEHSLVNLVVRHNGEYVVQHPDKLIMAARQLYTAQQRKAVEAMCAKLLPERLRRVALHWFARNGRVYTFIPEWMAGLQRYEYVVGTRIHGIMMGIQAGVPSVCLYVDSRTRELCETMGIPCANAHDFANGITLADVRSILDGWSGEDYDANRLRLAKTMIGFIEDNGIARSGHLDSLIGTAADLVEED